MLSASRPFSAALLKRLCVSVLSSPLTAHSARFDSSHEFVNLASPSPDALSRLSAIGLSVWPTFLSPSSARQLFQHVTEDVFPPGRMLETHYDGVIHEYREREVRSDSSELLAGLERRVREEVVEPCLGYKGPFRPLHIIWLSYEGRIDAHVDVYDRAAFQEDSLAGAFVLILSLGSHRVLRLTPESGGKEGGFDVLLPPGSLYLMEREARYEYSHAILDRESTLDVWEEEEEEEERVSIVFRQAPKGK